VLLLAGPIYLFAHLAENSVAFDFARRRSIYRAGDPADSLFAIAQGRIKLCRIEPGTGREAVIDLLSAGSLFGESAKCDGWST